MCSPLRDRCWAVPCQHQQRRRPRRGPAIARAVIASSRQGCVKGARQTGGCLDERDWRSRSIASGRDNEATEPGVDTCAAPPRRWSWEARIARAGINQRAAGCDSDAVSRPRGNKAMGEVGGKKKKILEWPCMESTRLVRSRLCVDCQNPAADAFNRRWKRGTKKRRASQAIGVIKVNWECSQGRPVSTTFLLFSPHPLDPSMLHANVKTTPSATLSSPSLPCPFLKSNIEILVSHNAGVGPALPTPPLMLT